MSWRRKRRRKTIGLKSGDEIEIVELTRGELKAVGASMHAGDDMHWPLTVFYAVPAYRVHSPEEITDYVNRRGCTLGVAWLY